MSGFSYHHEHSDASSLQSNNFVHVPSPFHQDDTVLWRHSNNECFQDYYFPFHHFQLKEANYALSPIVDAAAAARHDAEVPSSAIVCGLSASYIAGPNAEMGVAQMPTRRKKINSKKIIPPKQNDEKKSKGGKMEKEQGSGTPPVMEYIHVRARRGQATDSHSLAERVRREKIGERMKLLQSLVPGCDKIAGKAQILDEIINYVQSLQTQVQVLVGKMAILSPYMSDNEANLGVALPASTESICRLEASLSSSMMLMMMESSCNLLHFADDSHHNSLLSASSSSSLTSKGDQRNFISQGTEVPMCEMDVQGHFGAIDDQYWLDRLTQVDQ